jgi:hypothetical protein
MAYVRRLISEQYHENSVIRRYDVETPRSHYEWNWKPTFPKLVELELRISHECAHYFRMVPYSLAEAIWVNGLEAECGVPFCCVCECCVLYYPREPKVWSLTKLGCPHEGPVVLEVTLRPDSY